MKENWIVLQLFPPAATLGLHHTCFLLWSMKDWLKITSVFGKS